MRHIQLAILTLVVSLALTATAYAAPITGTITFGGVWLPTGGTGVEDAIGVDIQGDNANVTCAGPEVCSGAYAGITGWGVVANYHDFTFDPLGGNITPLWSLHFAGVDYWFDLEEVTVVTQNSSFLTLTGMGTLYADDYDPTPGLWSFSGDTTSGQSIIAFSATNSATEVPVPEPASLVLLGLGLLSAGYIRRRR